MREEMIANGVKFLQHPSVQSTPLSERVSFLEQKGMTKEEIQEAIERHQSGAAPSAVAAAPPMGQAAYAPVVSAPPPHMVLAAAAPIQQLVRKARYPAYVRVLWTVSSLVGAASILTFLWNYAVQAGYLPWFRTPRMMLEAAKVDEEREEEKKKDEALLTSLSDVSTAIQAQTAELVKLSESLDQKEHEMQSKSLVSAQIASSLTEQATMQSIAELKAEISTLKALLVTKSESSSTNSTAATSASTSESASPSSVAASSAAATSSATAPPPVPVKPKETRRERMLNALKKLRTQNTREQLELAAGILGMYVKNLVENPDVPRYRRIARGNVNFKQKIEPLQHHEELLKSVGFEPAGLNMEWKWHTASRQNGDFDENIAILRALLAALQSLTSKSAASNLSLEEIAEASITSSASSSNGRPSADEPLEDKAPVPTTPASSGVSPPNVFQTGSASSTQSSPPDLSSFMARLEQKASAVNDSSAANKSSVATPMATAVSESVVVSAAPASAVAAGDPKVEGGPTYPKSFTEVMELIKKGEPVPGIREIEEKLSVDSAALLQDGGDDAKAEAEVAAAPSKPWEKMLKA